MPTYGLLTTGFVPKTLDDIVLELQNAFKAAFGNSINLTELSVFSQFIGIMAERFAELWELQQAVYSAADPDNAEGDALVQICALTGTIPHPATNSTVTITATGTNGTVLPVGRAVSVANIGTRFVTTAAGTLVSGTAWATSTGYVVGNRRVANAKVYVCITSGTSAGSGLGPNSTAADITDGTVHWRYIGAGSAYVDIDAESEETGPKIAESGDLTVIETPVAGWTGVMNLLDAVPGENVESDAELRVRREAELLGASRSTMDSIRTRLLEDLDQVYSVTVFENTADTTNGDGMPPHSVEALVHTDGDDTGADDQDIIDILWQNVAAGITYHGTTSGTYVDVDNGNQSYTVKFSRPAPIDVYVIANLIKDPLFYPADGDTQVRDAILAVGRAYATGKNVVSSQLKAACFSVAGVLDVTTLYIGTAPAPASEVTIAVALRELAMLDSSRTTVNSSDGVP